MTETIIAADIVAQDNTAREAALIRDYAHLGEQLDRRGIAIDAIRDKVAAFHVAVPSWGVGTGGTRFARFPGDGEPRDIFDKIEDCAVIQQLTRATPTVSLHIPWDKADPQRLKQAASRFGLSFDAMNSNTFSDAKDQALSYKFGSLSHADAAVRRQAVEHNLECIEIGSVLGSKALTVWIGDGSNFPGQVNFTRQFEHYLDAMKADLRRPARRLAPLHRAQDVRAGLLFDGRAGLGHQLHDRPRTRRSGLLSRRPRPPCAERQHRDDRRAAHPVRRASASSTQSPGACSSPGSQNGRLPINWFRAVLNLTVFVASSEQNAKT